MSHRRSEEAHKQKSKLTEHDLFKALERHFDPRGYAVLQQVRSAVGLGQYRVVDALVMSLWPSRGIELIGVEIKTSRSDWLNELKQPSKAEAVCQYCDRWYILAVDESIVRKAELPDTWGLMVANPRSGVRVMRKAPKLKPTPITHTFLASILRSTKESIDAWTDVLMCQKRADDEYFLRLADSGYLVLACPLCGGGHTHQGAMEIFDRTKEDSEDGLHLLIKHGKHTVDRSMVGNPSGRRQGMTIEFECEICSKKFAVIIAQHKGETLVFWNNHPKIMPTNRRAESDKLPF